MLKVARRPRRAVQVVKAHGSIWLALTSPHCLGVANLNKASNQSYLSTLSMQRRSKRMWSTMLIPTCPFDLLSPHYFSSLMPLRLTSFLPTMVARLDEKHVWSYVYVCVNRYVHVCIYIYIHTHIYIHIYIMYIYIYVYIHIYTYIYV